MNIHLSIVLLTIVSIGATLSMSTVLSISSYKVEGSATWVGAFIAAMLSCGLFILRGTVNDSVAIVGQNLSIYSAFALFTEGVFKYKRRPPPRLLIWLPVVLMAALLLIFLHDLRLRIVVLGLTYSIQCLFAFFVLLKERGATPSRGQYILATGLVGFVGVFVLRAVRAATGLGSLQSFMVSSAVDVGAAYLGAVCLLVVSQGLMVMIKERADERIRMLATRDSLTGLANRRRLDETLVIEWARAQRTRSPLALLMIDVDFFKEFNDIYGHQAGDRCLVAIARVLQATTRRATDLAARYGGEEFIVVLPGASIEVARALAEDIRRSVEAMPLPNARAPMDKVTVSVGVAGLGAGSHNDMETLLGDVDRALYLAKANGRNQVQLATTSPSIVPVNRLGTSSSSGRIKA
jgi:diguanylate cyclase (GGDEF)-like protein